MTQPHESQVTQRSQGAVVIGVVAIVVLVVVAVLAVLVFGGMYLMNGVLGAEQGASDGESVSPVTAPVEAPAATPIRPTLYGPPSEWWADAG